MWVSKDDITQNNKIVENTVYKNLKLNLNFKNIIKPLIAVCLAKQTIGLF